MLQSLYISLSLGLPVIVSSGASGTAEVSLVAPSACWAGTSYASEGNLLKLSPEQERVACIALPANLCQDQPGFVAFHILSLKYHCTQPAIYGSP